ncbi:GNAT family N-acetyltransferase [Tabrizicola oligotrophica]|uniref:L-ornithine N(alpha)-acyltransferase n=1 Tax=Tabrizicola oligotrophica TaxID=2710650 RepID=A0A6M0QYK8_9RHOB|nr:GNAT family N-acyltransferase [Tabrizicola oligotrophica]NEY92101.1 GNAT family N-acetyltransferase [Tabrizicola oligotrophica]
MIDDDNAFVLRLARDERDLRAAQRLRYRVFVQELGAEGPMVDHDQQLETDAFDPHFDHLLLIDPRRDAARLDDVVGAYRLLPSDRLSGPGRYYSESEYDLTALKATGRKLVELGRSCVHPAYRGGSAMLQLWNALAGYVLERDIEVLFGTASFHGTDVQALAQPLSYLAHHHLAPPELRVRALPPHAAAMDIVPPAALDRRAALSGTPALIKAYLRLGGFVGEGAFVDHEFNTTDVCLILDTAGMSDKHREFWIRKKAARG